MAACARVSHRWALTGLTVLAAVAPRVETRAMAQTSDPVVTPSITATPRSARRNLDIRTLTDIQRWRVVLGGTGAVLTGHERLVAIHRDGRVIGTADGSAEGVSMPISWTDTLRSPAADVILVHNHPQGQSLSAGDLWQLAKPGVAAIVAVGHDGSLYVAAAGPAFNGFTFVDEVYLPASQRVERLLQLSGRTNGGVIAPHRNHLVALSLARAGVIDYHAALGGDRKASYNGYAVTFESIVNLTAAEIRSRMVHAEPRRPR